MNKRTVYVGGFDQQINEDILYSTFIPFGDIVDIKLPKFNDKNRGFANVEVIL